jgi:D-alanyl-D-alanine carboxypeptidase
MEKTFVKVPKIAIIGGTTAQLRKHDKISLKDLMYGLMLPSGNDAAITLAVFFGRLLVNKRKFPTKNYLKIFIKAMNSLVRKYGCFKTIFKNPHGLYYKENFSTCEEVSKLGRYALKIPFLKQMVSVLKYKASIKSKSDRVR